jgi:hypothetical protein
VNLTTLDNALWAGGLLGNVALLLVLVYKRRWRMFPWLCAYVSFAILLTVCLFLAYRFGSRHLYAEIYWSSALVDLLLQVAVVVEIAIIVMRPATEWLHSSRSWFWTVTGSSASVAFLLAWCVHPSAPSSLDAWEVRGNLFCSILICELFTAVLFTSQNLGLHWRSHVMSLGYGLTTWAIVSLVVDMLHGYWGSVTHFAGLEHVRILSYLGALFFWTLSFWREEPERKPATPEMRDAILHLTDRVSYDLAKVLGTRGKEFH